MIFIMNKVLLIGDNCIDEYHYGTIDRISPEAPVPVFELSYKETKLGMAANVQDNLLNLGLDVITHLSLPSIKTRLIDSKSKQHIIRIDDDYISEPLMFEDIKTLDVDAIIISDYNKGYVSYELVEELRKVYLGPIFIDTKKQDLSRFDGCIVKINENEFNRKISSCDQMIVTFGEKNVMYKTLTDCRYYTVPKLDVFDVCGAGDTFLSALTYKYLESLGDIDAAIQFAIKAASKTVQHIGVYSPKKEEIF